LHVSASVIAGRRPANASAALQAVEKRVGAAVPGTIN
jgi:hypothetical protein